MVGRKGSHATSNHLPPPPNLLQGFLAVPTKQNLQPSEVVCCWTQGQVPFLGTNVSPPKGTFKDDVPFPKVKYVSSLEGANISTNLYLRCLKQRLNLPQGFSDFSLFSMVQRLLDYQGLAEKWTTGSADEKWPANVA